MKTEDVVMTVRFHTHCPKCGSLWQVESQAMVPEPMMIREMMSKMFRDLETEPRICCKKRIPKISTAWEKVWPSVL